MEEFILKVRSNPCLWDSSSVFFRDNARKHATWKSVAMECGMADVSEAKSIWKRLRDSHREAMRRRKIAQQTLAPWKYEDLMDFLLPQPNNIDNNGSNFTIEEEDNEEYPNIECEVSEDEDIKPNIVDVTIEPTNNPPIMEVNKRESFLDNLEEREKRRAEQNRQRSDLRKQLIDGNRNTEDDALTHLFTSLCQKTRTLPKHLQLRVQREIFESVTKA
ncbi:uncharacterized protein LOC114354943 [Ostrinia furnacalis]|uniref:uncharacterized protein LOC114354943 n=1 Tax=Ostrinia furnacalis TaxID=93504 RepID=UPI00103CB3FC|nr:uncharacterized protein LOC114354943 [Ostrinia furnacalis]